MNNFSHYKPVSGFQRLWVFIGNGFLAMIALNASSYIAVQSGMNDSETAVFYIITMLACIALFCFFPESPCKRLGRFKILTKDGNELDYKTRLIRASLYFFLIASFSVFPCLPESMKENSMTAGLLALPYLLAHLFIFANGICVFFHPEKCSLLDMKLGTRVMKPPPTPEHLKTKLFGRKII